MAHEVEVIAKSKGKEVGKKKIQVADTMADAVKIAGSEAKVLELFNRQLTTDTRNAIARPSTGGVELRTKVDLYKKMVASNIPADKALTIAGITADDVKKVEEAVAAPKKTA